MITTQYVKQESNDDITIRFSTRQTSTTFLQHKLVRPNIGRFLQLQMDTKKNIAAY